MIKWLKIEHAETVAMGQGFAPIDVPWVTSSFLDGPVVSLATSSRHLLRSGEQGLLHVWDKLSPDTKYVTTTPCFRQESSYEPGVVEPWFMQTSLFWVGPRNEEQAMNVILGLAKRIMGTWARKFEEVKSPDGSELHLILNGLKVGSYGIRSHEGKIWSYGTGLAEPRFTTALNRTDNRVLINAKKRG